MPGPSDPNLRGRNLALLGVVVNVGLSCAKLVAGLVGHSYALVADAVESLSDIAGSVIIWSGLRVGAIPPDDDHPYGHGKAEALAALVVAVMIGVAGVGIAVEAINGMGVQREAPKAWTLIVLVIVIVVKECLYRFEARAARQSGSVALHVDAWHHRLDAMTSIVAFLGVLVAVAGGGAWAQADNWAALAAAGVVLFNAVKLMVEPLNELMDRRQDEVCERCRTEAATIPGVRAIEKINARKSGARYYVDIHVEVDPQMSVLDSHALTGKIKAALRERVSGVAGVLVHIEPWREAPGAGAC